MRRETEYITLFFKMKNVLAYWKTMKLGFVTISKSTRAYGTPNSLQGSLQIKCVALALMISPAVSFT